MKAALVAPISEAAFTRQVLDLAKLHGWRSFHARPGRTVKGWRTCVQGDGKGWPDVFLLHPPTGRVLVMELKTGNNKASPEQRRWLSDFQACGIPAYLFYPRDWDTIERVLEGGRT